MDYKESETTFQTKKLESTFIYEGLCVCEETQFGETGCNVELRQEYENISKDSESELKENLSNKFSWKILFTAPENQQIRKIFEASEIEKSKKILIC